MAVPFGITGRHTPVAAEDQAGVIAGILENPAPHAGKIYPLSGPIEVTNQKSLGTNNFMVDASR
jgi:NAD(P)H dehydrogenase (quinone)